jgi:hypothetical protein
MPRIARRWLFGVLGSLTAIFLLYLGLVLLPSPLFAHHQRFGDYRVYSDVVIPSDFSQVMADTSQRVAAMDPPAGAGGARIYLCRSRRLYRFFALLTRKNPESLAIGLSAAGEMFVSMDRVREFAEKNGGVFRHTRFEGNPAEVIAHEIAHFNSVRAVGYRAHYSQPVWKSEGWAEYQANLAAIRSDPGYDLGRRIELLLDDDRWRGGRTLARSLWEWQVLVEYLGEVEGFSLTDMIRDEITRSDVKRRMLDWYRALPAEPTANETAGSASMIR